MTIAILGDVNSGKSVFVTCAFAELAKPTSRTILSISDYSTIERVFSDLRLLRNRQWLAKTAGLSPGSVFTYEAHIVQKGLLVSKTTRILIPDYAGEVYRSAIGNDMGKSWFHNSPYFRFVLNSQAIFLALDVSATVDDINNCADPVAWQAQRFLAALHIYCRETQLKPNKAIKIPVCLLLMKADLVSPELRASIEENVLSELKSFCITRCKHFKQYWVSSTGQLMDKNPPFPLNPENVTEPILWAVTNR